jgi:hypothetical protein
MSESTSHILNEQSSPKFFGVVFSTVFLIIAGPDYIGLSDITPIQKKHDVSGLFYKFLTFSINLTFISFFKIIKYKLL